jgi:DNA repair protein RecO (recombination protein O)
LREPIDGIVVGSVDLGEADRILRLLTAEEGRISVVARGARGSKRRFANMTDLGTHLRVVRGRQSGTLSAVIEAERLSGPDRARTDLERLSLLAYGCELCSALAPEEDAAPKLHGLLLSWLVLLEGAHKPGVASRVALEAKALTFSGLVPALGICASCGLPLQDPVTFDPEAGGGRHSRCGPGRHVPLGTLHYIELLRRTPLAETADMPDIEEAWLLSDFAQYQLGQALQARAWFEALG